MQMSTTNTFPSGRFRAFDDRVPARGRTLVAQHQYPIISCSMQFSANMTSHRVFKKPSFLSMKCHFVYFPGKLLTKGKVPSSPPPSPHSTRFLRDVKKVHILTVDLLTTPALGGISLPLPTPDDVRDARGCQDGVSTNYWLKTARARTTRRWCLNLFKTHPGTPAHNSLNWKCGQPVPCQAGRQNKSKTWKRHHYFALLVDSHSI